ncbi:MULTISPECIES: TetR/AcrR family transcriptional regulator [unclassified Kitasatospora]|uniref:TetR/AcrR family transcriptional regulator n=1 Tax=unclassified Kitasatospora TaxID=2633591 RepID=UPI001ADFF77B|nr:TetR/AcrR family transcriptional regulator [Kitasatospora sp. RG8]MBP0450088.1 TetR/AcrR family transcriptional regulator [Kitasatospora sp. RG8]
MTPPRPMLIADTAIALIAERGLRGLTHRAVDEAAGLPPGSTSNLARTRAALLELALTRIAERESPGVLASAAQAVPVAPAAPEALPRDLLAQVAADAVHQALTAGRALTVARFELALEATRRPELRAVYDRLGAGFVDFAVSALERCGSRAPEADARRLVRWCEGVLINGTAGSGHGRTPGPAELREEVAVYLAALLDREA